MEFRIKDVDIECNSNSEEMKIGGYINITNRESEVLFSKKRRNWFKEIITIGAFKRSLEKNSDIPLLVEHDFSKEVARTTNGNLFLYEDKLGLRFDAIIEDRDLYNKIQSGAINSCSFGFRVLDEEFERINPKLEKRYVKDLELIECSLVERPAYEGSLVEIRQMMEELEKEQLNEELEKEQPKEEVAPKDATIDVIDSEDEKIENNTHKENESGQDNKENTTDTMTMTMDATEVEETNEEEIVENSEVVEIKDEVEVETKSLEPTDKYSMSPSIILEDEKSIMDDARNGAIEDAKEVVDGVIATKEEELSNVQTEEILLNEHMDYIKEENKKLESSLEFESMRLSKEVVRLRLELLKLKQIKERLA